MTDAQQREAARNFYNRWRGREASEKSETHPFWLELLTDVYGMDRATEKIIFEREVVVDGNTKFIDAYLPETKVLIEQKSGGISLDKALFQSGSKPMTPYEQAKRYWDNLPFDERSRWIITCNFREFNIYDMNAIGTEPQKIQLSNLMNDYHRLNFLVDDQTVMLSREMAVSMQAGDIVGELYDALIAQYIHPDDPHTLKSLNALCVRLVFCLYAEDAGLFGRRGLFNDYLKRFDIRDLRRAMKDLFAVLDTPADKRDPYMDPALSAFPFVNGGLFADEDIEIPNFTNTIRDLLITKASAEFDWSAISPTIFGAVFESTLNPVTRREGGMHYTSIENIHKVIDPLFLDDLKAEFSDIQKLTVLKTRARRLEDFQNRLASLRFLDPACGSGNFLTESYLALRRLENEVLREKIICEKGQEAGQIVIGTGPINPIKVSISQFYGIEINDFAVTVARTALWIAESQMLKETEDVVHTNIDFLPLKSYATIREDNAVTMDWNAVVPREKLDYIMGNPPFVGARVMNAEQKRDINKVFAGWRNAGNLDYVACWYKKAADYMARTSIQAALVSTNSVTQGESVANLWQPLFAAGITINFAHRTFRWDSEAKIKAHVHCVIVGFSTVPTDRPKVIYEDGQGSQVSHINAYLADAPDVFVSSRSTPLCDVPAIGIGNQPVDNGNYLFTQEEMEAFIRREPWSAQWFRPWYGSREFIHRAPRYCLWLGKCPPSELLKMPECLKRVDAVRDYRLASKRKATVKLADSPTHFQTENMPEGQFILIPKVSSKKRRYIPTGFMDSTVLCSDLVMLMPHATLYHFGVLTSNVHNGWMRTVCGRLKSDYRYSKDVVYNNFPWPTPTAEQKAQIEASAQGILDARALYPDSSLADLYGEHMNLFPELVLAHRANDRAVMKAYGFDFKTMSEGACVTALLKLYQTLAE